MKVVILAGGYGTRISEESHLRPKPMIEVGEKPIIWHIMKTYAYYGFDEFIICAGYKQQIIKEWFSNYFLYNSDITFDFTDNNRMIVHNNVAEPWKVTIIDTGINTMTGGRIKRIEKFIGNERFLMTYGDGVSNVDIRKVVEFHAKKGGLATLTAVQPEGRFGYIDIENDKIKSFREKDKSDMGWINGGFMVLEPGVFDFIKDDNTIFEQEPLEQLANQGLLNSYKHHGFWQCMDTMRDHHKLEELWTNGKAPWKLWKE